jgi:hypothetical protein
VQGAQLENLRGRDVAVRTETTMSVDVMVRNLRAYLARHPQITRTGCLLAHLGKELGSPGPEGLTLVKQALDLLESNGEVRLTKRGNASSPIYDGVTLRQRQNHTNGSGIRLAPSATRGVVVYSDLRYDRNDPREVTLTKALQTLRRTVGPSGHAEGLNIKTVLIERMGLPKSLSSNVMDQLRTLGLYRSEQVGFHRTQLTVAGEPEEVTAAMVRQALEKIAAVARTRKEAKEEISPKVAQADAKPPTAAKADSVPAASTTPTSPVAKLGTMATAQRTALLRLSAELNEARERGDKLNQRVLDLERELDVAQRRIRELEAANAADAKLAQEILDGLNVK